MKRSGTPLFVTRAAAFSVAALVGCFTPVSDRAAETAPLPNGLYAEFTTPRGVVICELHPQKTPLTVASFVGLAEGTLGPAPRKPFFNGLKLHRVVPDFVVQGGDPLLNDYMRDLATKLSVDKQGALALYLADRDEWKLWIGDDSAAKFIGRPGTAKDFMQGDAFHEAKQGFLDAARATGDADFTRQKKSLTPDQQPPPAQNLKLQTDAVLDGLILKLEPK